MWHVDMEYSDDYTPSSDQVHVYQFHCVGNVISDEYYKVQFELSIWD